MEPEDAFTKAVVDTVGKVAVNVYADTASPAARKLGTALETVFKVGLSPISLLDWGFEKSKIWLSNRIEERWGETPTQYRQAPPAHFATPLLLSIAASADVDGLRELYAELLLKTVDSRTVSVVHPSYVSVLGQLTPQEAFVFLSFRGKLMSSLFIDRPRTQLHSSPTIEIAFNHHCTQLGFHNSPSDLWLQNLLRLRLVQLDTYTDAVYRAGVDEFPEPSVDTVDERHLTLTEYGNGFLEACAPPGTREA